MTLYVWSGSLRGAPAVANTPAAAVDAAVRANLPCVLGGAIRVSRRARGLDDDDVYFQPPYEQTFPSLFTGDLDVQVRLVTKDT